MFLDEKGVLHKSEGKKSKGKGKGKGKSKGNGKGKGDNSNWHQSYYFEVFPDKARGRTVVKCPKKDCFGCCLDGDKRPHACTRCGTPL